MKKTIFITLLCLATALMLTGCASNADTEPSPSAGITTPGVNPMTSAMPNATDNGNILNDIGNGLNNLGDALGGRDGQQLTSAEDALTVSKELRDAVQKLTEVDTAVAVAAGNTALVGVSFNSSYQGKVDDRLRAMVLDRAKAIHPAITTVAITDDESMISEISSLYQMLQSGSPYTTIKANADSLAEGLDMYKE